MVKISVITCVNSFELYESCVVSSVKGDKNIELIPVDNCRGVFSAASALNHGLKEAKGDMVVFCHQDVVFPENWLDKLLAQIDAVKVEGKKWGVLGTFGVTMKGEFAGNVVDPHNNPPSRTLPVRVQSLDEHCLIVRKDSGLRFDEELGGFHFYGADICLQARQKGMKCYAIDACIEHISGGKADDGFHLMAEKFCRKWKYNANAPNIIETTCGIFRIKEGVKAEILYFLAKCKRSFRRHKNKLLNRQLFNR